MDTRYNLEYNDGLGDLLRERDRHRFSWRKTFTVLFTVVAVIFVGLAAAFHFGKTLFLQKGVDSHVAAVADVKPAAVEQAQSQTQVSAESAPAQAQSSTEADPKKNAAYQDKIDKIEKENLALISEMEKSLAGQVKTEAEPAKKEVVVASVEPAEQYTKSERRAERAATPVAAPKATARSLSSPSKKDIYPYKVVAGAFANYGNANLLRDKLVKVRVESFISSLKDESKTLYRVQAGAFSSYKEAMAFKESLSKKGFDAYIVQP